MESQLQQQASKYYARITPPPSDPGVESKVKIQLFTFSEHDQIAYQIKGNRKCSNTVANILPADPYPRPPRLGVWSKCQNAFFRIWPCCISNQRE